MADSLQQTSLSASATEAVHLSAQLNSLQLTCGHESTSQDISKVAQELLLLSDELYVLDKDVGSNQDQYTTAFHQDLAEILLHLQGIFEDISDCCLAMRKADNPSLGAVTWLHKKRYVNKLQKHLAANKTTLVVMRTVLHHGKDYGKQNSPGRLAESSPHTLHEDWAILESVFASRNAIADLQELANKSHDYNSAPSSAAATAHVAFEPGPHGRNLSNVTGVDTPDVADVLPATHINDKNRHDDLLARRFSRRGVRLAVHSAILSLNAGDAPTSLKQKWIAQARRQQSLQHAYPSIAQLSNISEADSNPSKSLSHTTSMTVPHPATPETESCRLIAEAKIEKAETSPNESKAKKKSLSLINTSMGQALGRAINRLAHFTVDDSEKHGNPLSGGAANGHAKPHAGAQHCDDGKGRPEKSGWTYRLTKPFMQPELTTPDYNKDMENYR